MTIAQLSQQRPVQVSGTDPSELTVHMPGTLDVDGATTLASLAVLVCEGCR